MIDICINVPGFPKDSALISLLESRRLTVSRAAQDGCHTLVVGGGLKEQKQIVEMGRKMGAKRVVLVDTNVDTWSVLSEMGGRLLRVNLPISDLDAAHDAALIMLANLLSAPFDVMIAADPASGRLVDIARRVAAFDVSVFINGPTGSGKEVVSRMVHAASARAEKPFIALNCAALPENMLEGLLFGHEKGAFTGAATANKGYIRAADGGTLLLDEISEMPIALQSKLLRVLQEKVVTPLGSQTETAVDVRIIATSNRDMPTEIARGTFREDLYYRLNVFPIATLALAARPLDIPVLAQALLERHTPAGSTTPLLSAAALDVLTAHDWPGNVRELENVMQRALVLTPDAVIQPDSIMLDTRSGALPLASAA